MRQRPARPRPSRAKAHGRTATRPHGRRGGAGRSGAGPAAGPGALALATLCLAVPAAALSYDCLARETCADGVCIEAALPFSVSWDRDSTWGWGEMTLPDAAPIRINLTAERRAGTAVVSDFAGLSDRRTVTLTVTRRGPATTARLRLPGMLLSDPARLYIATCTPA